VHNVEPILAAFLPYHDSSHFARLVGLLSLSGKWLFLKGVAQSSSPLPRSVLVRAATTDPSVLAFIVTNGLTDTSTPASSSLAASVTLDLCSVCPSLPENTVTLVLASALPCVRSVTRRETLAAALMCIAAVCGRAQVSSDVADAVTNTCLRRAVGGKTDSPFDSEPLLAAIVVLCFKPLPSISRYGIVSFCTFTSISYLLEQQIRCVMAHSLPLRCAVCISGGYFSNS
jgi:U3 small nucleolar RNA-associated protein 10